jgi:formylglycine-generating enzyme required for sulfatase activity
LPVFGQENMSHRKRNTRKQQSVFSKLPELFGDFHAEVGATTPPTEEEEKRALGKMIVWRQSSGRPPQTVPQEVEPVTPESQDFRQTDAPVVLVPPPASQPAPEVGVAPEREKAAVPTHTLGLTFVLVPAGTFRMGSPEHELGRDDDEIQHEVKISQGFYLQTTPVTQGQWQALMGANPASFVQEGADLPVAGVNWQDCQEFIEKMNALGEETYRLPTEGEWEYACRAGSPTALANGELTTLYCELDPTLDDIGFYCGNSGRRPQPVAQKHPNAWGLYDLHGNVAEWCQDWYGPYPDNPQVDPQGPPSGPGRVVRGGSWFSSAKNCRAAARFHRPPQGRSQLQTLGFRLVKIL